MISLLRCSVLFVLSLTGMQRKSNHIKLSRQRYLSIKAIINYCCIALLALSFSVQQFTAFANTYGSTSEQRYQSHTGHVSAGAQFSAHLPFESAPIGQEMEMEVAEEDETKNNIDEYCTPFVQKYSSGELLYTSSLRSRFLQLATSIHNRPSVPFFILHHSWKSYLS